MNIDPTLDGSSPTPPLSIGSWLSLKTPGDDVERLARLAALREDQHRRWRLGERVLAEEYLRHVPGLAEDASMALDIIYSEILLRAEFGEPLDEEDYRRRFPERAASLARLFGMYQWMREQSIREFSSAETMMPRGEGASASTMRDGNEPGTPLLPGYELLETLGVGGMSIVYKARQVALSRFVAVKVLKLTSDVDLSRLKEEARVIAQLSHLNVVQVFDVQVHQNVPYLVQELVQGGSLADHLEKHGPLAARAAATMVEAIAEGMQHAHEMGVIHRDLKPANVLLAAGGLVPGAKLQAGVPKITDFGLAKSLADEAGDTASGMILGTPSYMPPEQASGDLANVGPLSDVYSLGAILYECLTGKPPFRAASLFETLVQVRTVQPVSPRLLQPGVPLDLDTICLKCLHKSPAKRYGSARELADDLRRFQNGEPIKARPVSAFERARRWCRRKPAQAALIMVSVIAAFVLTPVMTWAIMDAARKETLKELAEREREAETIKREAAESMKSVQEYTLLLNNVLARSRLPKHGWLDENLRDLKRIGDLNVASRNRDEERRLAALTLSGIDLGPGKVVLDKLDVAFLAFTPDGKYLAAAPRSIGALGFVEPIRLVETATGKVIRTFECDGVLMIRKPDGIRSLAISPDGVWLAAGTRAGKVHCWRIEQNKPKAAHTWTYSEGKSVSALCFRGNSMLYAGSEEDLDLCRWNLNNGSDLRARMEHATTGMTDSPHQVLFRTAADLFQGINPDTLAVVPRPALANAARLTGPIAGVASQLTACVFHRKIALIDWGAGQVTQTLPLAGGNAHERGPETLHISADGQLLVSACPTDDDRRVKLWEMVSGQLLLDFSSGHLSSLTAALSPDSRMLAVSADNRVTLYPLIGAREQTYRCMKCAHISTFDLSRTGEIVVLTTTTLQGNQTVDRGIGWYDETGLKPKVGMIRNNATFDLEQHTLVYHPRIDETAHRGGDGGTNMGGPAKAPAEVGIPDTDSSVLAIDPDGGRLWAVAKGTLVRSWNWGVMQTRTEWNVEGFIKTGREGLRSLAAGRQWVLAGGRDGRLHMLRSSDGKPERSVKLTNVLLKHIAIHPNDGQAVVGTQDGEVLLVAVPSGVKMQSLTVHSDQVECVAFSPNGKLVASGGRDGNVHLSEWQGDRYMPFATIPLPTAIHRLRFHPDEQHLVVLLHKERGLRYWDLKRLRQRFQELGL